MTEEWRSWEAQVARWLKQGGWDAYHTHDSRCSPAGFPDYVAIRVPRRLVIECKSGRGQVTPAQAHWLDLFEAIGFEVYVWYPQQAVEAERVLLGGIPVRELVMRDIMRQSRPTGRRKKKAV